MHILKIACLALCATAFCASAPANAANDPLAAIQSFTLKDVKQAEKIYAANPSVVTYGAAVQCLGYLDTTLSASNAGDVGSLVVPKGIVSAVADLDIALNGAGNGLSPAVTTFNQNCGAYIEDLKAEAVAVTAKGAFTLPFGIKF